MPSGGLEVRFLYSAKRRLAAREVAIAGVCGGGGGRGGRWGGGEMVGGEMWEVGGGWWA